MKDAILSTQKTYQTDTQRTPAYIAWHSKFKLAFTKFLKTKGATRIEIGSPNHFDMSGFFTIANQVWYFRIEDIRWSKDKMLIRTARSYKDYTGGENHFASLKSDTEFFRDFQSAIKFSSVGFLV